MWIIPITDPCSASLQLVFTWGPNLRLSKSEVEGVGKSAGMDPRDSRQIIKLWLKSSCRSLIAPENPITQKPWLWTPLLHQEMTQHPVLAPVRQRFFFFFLEQHCGATFPNSVSLKAALAIWQPEETVSATIDIFPILLACHLPFSGHLIDSDSLYWVFHMKENFVIKC